MSCKDTFMASSLLDHHILPNLHSILFGEGIMNDAISLALFQGLEHDVKFKNNFWSSES